MSTTTRPESPPRFEFSDALELEALKRRRVTKDTDAATAFPFTVQFAHDVAPTAKTSSPTASPASSAEDRQQWLDRLSVTPEQAVEIAKYVQGSSEWLQSRVGRITASNFGAAAGLNTFMSPRALLKQLLWGGFHGCEATRWGNDNELNGKLSYLRNKREEFGITKPGAHGDGGEDYVTEIDVEDTGLVINPARSWMGNSPDGIIHLTYHSGRTEKGLLEIKCPFKKMFYTPDPVPVYYYAQIQGTMGNLQLSWCDFVVWTPSGTQITRVPFDPVFWNDQLLPKVSHFYFETYVPLAIRKQKGLLATGKIV
jgi:hypothetical protein